MTDQQLPVEHVEDSNPSSNPHFNEILNAQINRRSVLRGGAGMTAAMMLGGMGLVGCSSDDDAVVTTPVTPAPTAPVLPKTLGFKAVPHSLADQVIVPEGYQVQLFIPMGTPLVSWLPDWNDDGLQSGESFEYRVGDNHDGMHFFGLKNGKYDGSVSDHGLLVVNHEYVNSAYLNPMGFMFKDDATAPTYRNRIRLANDVRREVNCHGVSVIEVKRDDQGQFSVVPELTYNRRLTSATEMMLEGAAAGSDWMKTKYNPAGLKTRGINNQCGSGWSPWGTFLTTEENWVGAFARGEDQAVIGTDLHNALARYGIGENARSRYYWNTPSDSEGIIADEFSRWDITATAEKTATQDYRNAIHTFGYIVEIDPFNSKEIAVKRTSLGRFAHENISYAPVKAGQPVVFYSGDDARGEYVYKFVSKAVWDAKDLNGGMAAGAKYLNDGTLYVAVFAADGKGYWEELSMNNPKLKAAGNYPFKTQADICVLTRLAADAVGATKMDRPEWVDVSPVTGETYLTLTNNVSSQRPSRYPLDAANPRNYDLNGDGSLDGNPNGHIIRWRSDNDNHAAIGFTWDVYVFGAPYNHPANLSGLTKDNDFSSPDGLWFDPTGALWVQTDDGAYTDTTNCMMLVALPGKVSDGASMQVGDVTTYMGSKPTASNLVRFLVGPIECEITGVTFTPDMKAVFANVQHPGEDGSRAEPSSHWPASQTNATSTRLPRSATVIVTRKDGKALLDPMS